MPPFGTLIVFDMEFTSWPGSVARLWQGENEFPEIVQIGAVKANSGDHGELAAFSCYVQPVRHPILSDYFTNLTGITQERIEREGLLFADAFNRFMDFIGPETTSLCCNGRDIDFLKMNCQLHGIAFPPATHDIRPIELQHFFKKVFPSPDGRQPQSWRLPELAGLGENPGHAHDALDDSRAILRTLGALAARGLSPF